MTSDVEKMNDKYITSFGIRIMEEVNVTDASCYGATMYDRCFVLSFWWTMVDGDTRDSGRLLEDTEEG